MNNREYVENVLKTESVDFPKIKERLESNRLIRLLHAATGMVTESAEFLDAIKKYVFYGKDLDEVNLIEEIGDKLWYIAIALDELGVDIETVRIVNIRKLKKRYSSKFKETEAVDRNLDEEREVVEYTLDIAANDLVPTKDLVPKR